MGVTEHHHCLDISPLMQSCEECPANCGQRLQRQREWFQMALCRFKMGLIRLWLFTKLVCGQTSKWIISSNTSANFARLCPEGEAGCFISRARLSWELFQGDVGVSSWDNTLQGAGMGLLLCSTSFYIPGKVLPALRQHNISLDGEETHNPSVAQRGHSGNYSIPSVPSQTKGIPEIWGAVPNLLHYCGFFSSVCHEDQKLQELFINPKDEPAEERMNQQNRRGSWRNSAGLWALSTAGSSAPVAPLWIPFPNLILPKSPSTPWSALEEIPRMSLPGI